MLGRDYFSIYTACKCSAETIFSFCTACNARQRLFFRFTPRVSTRQRLFFILHCAMLCQRLFFRLTPRVRQRLFFFDLHCVQVLAEIISSFYIACNVSRDYFFDLHCVQVLGRQSADVFTRDAMLGRISSCCKRDWSWEYIVFWLILYARSETDCYRPVAVVEFRKSRIQSFLPFV